MTHEYESIRITYTLELDYTPDFVLENGIIIEAKGYFRASDRRKHLAIREQYPDLDIRFLFLRANSRVAGAKMTCAEWCEKNNFKYAEKVIPHDWINETKPRTRDLAQFRSNRSRVKTKLNSV